MRRWQASDGAELYGCAVGYWGPEMLGSKFRVVGKPEVIPQIFRKILAAAVGRTGRSFPVLFQFANPNIAVADRVVVIL